VFWKEILKLVEHRESSGRAAETSGQKQARVDSKLLDTEEGPDEMFSLSGRMMLWTVGHPDGIPRRPDGCSDIPITVFWKEILKLVEH
jgi:hypothetical protein